jgi:K+-sensing histidine kinase KdpD
MNYATLSHRFETLVQVHAQARCIRIDAEMGSRVIDRQVDHLARLVNELLDVSRIMYGKISLQETMLEMSTVIHHAVVRESPAH